MRRLSVVIANFNYGRFVGAAVDSALALSWPDVEVVVVDDGSSDDSAEVLTAYGERIRFLRQPNAGQRAAANLGYTHCTGDVIVFLDADDVLPPDLPRVVNDAMRAGVSKVQTQMQPIDQDGVPFGRRFPAFRRIPNRGQIRRWMLQTSAYPTPPGSGNAYARFFLDQVMPVADSGDRAADSALIATAPFFGEVVTVLDPAVGYRVHGANDSNLLADRSRFAREVRRARSRWEFARRAAGLATDLRPLRRSRELLQLRCASIRVTPDERTLPGETRLRIAADAIRSPFQPGPEHLAYRFAVVAWALAVLSAPTVVSARLVRLRYRGRRP